MEKEIKGVWINENSIIIGSTTKLKIVEDVLTRNGMKWTSKLTKRICEGPDFEGYVTAIKLAVIGTISPAVLTDMENSL